MTRPTVVSAGLGTWSLGGPPGTATVAIVTASGLPGVVYAGNEKGLFKSSNNGQTWNLIAFAGQPTTAIATGQGASVYASSGYPDVILYRSLDGGLHWSVIGEGANAFFSVVEDPFVPTTLYRITTIPNLPSGASSLARSMDAGSTWTALDPPGLAPYSGLVADPSNPGVLYLVANSSVSGSEVRNPPIPVPFIFRTSDSGETWTRLSEIATGAHLSLDPAMSSTLYFGADQGPFRSTDSGATFTALATGVQGTTLFGQILVDPIHTNNLYSLTNAGTVAMSSDSGNHWTTGFALPWGYPTDFEIDSTGSFLHVAVGVGVLDLQIPSNPGNLHLNAAHPFTVTLSAVDPHTGQAAPGVATQVNDLWGYFSLPAITGNANNPEVFVKLLDGTAINGEFWFFYGGLTNLEYTLTVTDDSTGSQKTYTKPPGSECGGSDTAAFTP